MSTQIDQKAYLQKYLSGPSGDKKKKKKRNIKGKGLKIIDLDVDVSKMRPLEGDELDVFGEGEDAPQIAGIIDERPEEIKKLEQFKTSSKWRVITQDDGYNSKVKIEEIKRDVKEVEKENEIVFGKMYSDSEDEKKNNSDQSPPRKNSKLKEQSKNTISNRSDSDVSPPRRRETKTTSRKYDNDSDLSPPRKHSKVQSQSKNSKARGSDSDTSPPRREHKSAARKSNGNDSDLSPPRRHENKEKEKRKARKQSRWGYFESEEKVEKNVIENRNDDFPISRRRDSDESPPRNRKETSQRSRKSRSPDSDLSPPRKKYNQSDKGNYEKNYRGDKYNSSLQPNSKFQESSRNPRESSSRLSDNLYKKSSRHYADAKRSPTRRRQSPDNYRGRNKEKQYEQSPRRNESDSDQSPPRKRAPERYQNSDTAKMTKTLDGKKAGLQDARQLRQENDEFRRREDEAFERLNDEVSGRNAKAVARRGKRDTSEDREKQKLKAERQKEIDAKYQRWGKGLKQLEDKEARYQDFLHEASKPLARHKGDTDLENSLKQMERDGDPMLQYMRQKKRETGELGPEKPIYKGSFPPNRFNIRPGYRWDGVDRSNGYEKKFFDNQSKRKAQEEEAYKWSTEDL